MRSDPDFVMACTSAGTSCHVRTRSTGSPTERIGTLGVKCSATFLLLMSTTEDVDPIQFRIVFALLAIPLSVYSTVDRDLCTDSAFLKLKLTETNIRPLVRLARLVSSDEDFNGNRFVS